MKYKAYLVEENDGVYKGSVKEIDMPAIEPGNVIIKVHYSSLNYKDALAASGVKGVASTYPFVPGIDVAGEILESSSDLFNVGDKVIATGYKIGMKGFGGFGELVQIPAEWVVFLPENRSLKHAMSYGTAGLTAGACIKKMIDANIPKDMPIIVSGSTGGVGSVAVNLLSKLNYEVHAITGKPEEKNLLMDLGDAVQLATKLDFVSPNYPSTRRSEQFKRHALRSSRRGELPTSSPQTTMEWA